MCRISLVSMNMGEVVASILKEKLIISPKRKTFKISRGSNNVCCWCVCVCTVYSYY